MYVQGSRPDIQVPVREISLGTSTNIHGDEVANEPVHVYDTSGIYTDTERNTNIRQGLPANRLSWIEERGDVEAYDGREIKPEDNGLSSSDARGAAEVFPGLHRRPLRAKKAPTLHKCTTPDKVS